MKKQKGFTLIELIITMTLIGTIAAFFVNRYPSVAKLGRDTARKNTLRQYQTAIERYANINKNIFPIFTTTIAADQICSTIGLASTCTLDPKDGQTVCSAQTCRYYYQSNVSGTSYVLWAALEKPPSTAKIYYILCSNGSAGEGSAQPTGGTCPI